VLNIIGVLSGAAVLKERLLYLYEGQAGMPAPTIIMINVRAIE